MLNTVFPPWPDFSEEEGEAVKKVLMSNKVNYWTGTETREFEKEFAEYAECAYGIGIANGTLALELALLALGIGSGDEVIVTPRSFMASASCVVTIGARPVFADVDADTQNLSAETIEAVITPATKAILLVHLAGMPAEMDAIVELAKTHNLKIIEDCAQAHGAMYKGRAVGSFGDVGVWSFCQDKIMTTGGEGGFVTTNDESLWKKMWSYKDHGKSWDAVYDKKHAPGFRWLHESFGSNYRMTELQAVLGRIQLKLMPEWRHRRQTNANKIWESCRAIEWLRVVDVPDYMEHAAYKAYVFVRPEKLPAGWDRDKVLSELMSAGIPALSGSCSEIYLEKAFEESGFAPSARLPVAQDLGETSLVFLVHPNLQEEHIQITLQAINGVDKLIQESKP